MNELTIITALMIILFVLTLVLGSIAISRVTVEKQAIIIITTVIIPNILNIGLIIVQSKIISNI